MFTRRTLLCGVAALALLAVAVTAGKPSKPPPTPADPAILYNMNPGGDYQVWVMNEDGSNQTRLVSFATHEIHGMAANWAPGNRRFAFAGSARGYLDVLPRQIFVAELDLTNGVRAINIRPIYTNFGTGWPDNHGGVAGNPNWSPDGEWIFFHNHVPIAPTTDISKFDIFAIRSDGSGQPVQLTFTNDRDETRPSVDPYGRFLVYMADGALYKGTLGTDAGGLPVITEEVCLTDQGNLAGRPCDGTKIDLAGERVVTNTLGECWIIPLSAPYSPSRPPLRPASVHVGTDWLNNDTLVYTAEIAKPSQVYIAKADIATGAETILESVKAPATIGGTNARWPSAP